MTVVEPTLAEISEAVRSQPRVLAVGARTKPRLSQVGGEVALLSTRRLSGIVEYDPSEFTFTALAGTPVREIGAALSERGQYLPFDPLFLDAGSTLGGTIAAGLSGPGRFRFGGVRDFILGVQFVDGAGRLLRMGGKVVKNAAGFDLPKFFVGSLGRFGVLTEATFKVFPRPASTLTLRLNLDNVGDAAGLLTEAANTRWEPDALDLLPGGKTVLMRLAAPEPATSAIACEILTRWPGEVLAAEEADAVWNDLREFRWAPPGDALIKLRTTAAQILSLSHAASDSAEVRIHVSGCGDVAFVSMPDPSGFDGKLRELGIRGVTLRGPGPLWCGVRVQTRIEAAVKQALDPDQRFPALNETD